MTTQRAVVFLLVVGGLVLFAVQNASPFLPLAIFGVLTQPLPLSFWLVGAIAAGVITTLLMVGLLDLYESQVRPQSPKMGRGRPQASQRGRSPQYGKAAQSESSWSRSSDSPSGVGATTNPNQSGGDNADIQDWNTFKSPEQWDDWGQRPDPSVVADKPRQDAAKDKSRRRSRRQKEQYAVEESLEEIAGGWDEYEESGYERPAYVPRGGSPVEDTLDEISTGWDGYEDGYEEGYEEPEDKPTPSAPPKNYEVKQAPKTVYRSGSLYSYSYDKTEESDADQGEDGYPTDEPTDRMDDIEAEDYPTDTESAADNRQVPLGPGPGRVGPDGVYEADYRVIIPPSRKLDEEDDWEGG